MIERNNLTYYPLSYDAATMLIIRYDMMMLMHVCYHFEINVCCCCCLVGLVGANNKLDSISISKFISISKLDSIVS